MSTRGCIARLTSKPGKKIRLRGIYHHWDSYCEALGATLFQLRNGFFKGDTNALLKKLIDEHPAGWSTINDADFSIEPGFLESNYKSVMNAEEQAAYELYNRTPKCYCHGTRHEEANEITEKNASECGCEYVYAFTPDGKTMVVLSSYNENGSKMIGAFGMGNKNSQWHVIGEINLDGKEPKWNTTPIEQEKVIEPDPKEIERIKKEEENQKEIEKIKKSAYGKLMA